MKPPFEIVQRKVVEGGINLIFQHTACGAKVTLFIGNDDELKDIVLVNCLCGFQSRMNFGSPQLGRKLIDLLKLPSPEDRFGRAHRTSEN